MRKLKLEIESLAVESFAPDASANDAGTVRAYLTAYYELCQDTDTWQQSCTCEPTCNAQTCYQCPTGTCATGCGTCKGAACTGTCNPQSIPLTNCSLC